MNQLCDTQKKPWLNAAVNSLTIQSGQALTLLGSATGLTPVGGGLIQTPFAFPTVPYPTPLTAGTVLPYGGVISVTTAAAPITINIPSPVVATPGTKYRIQIKSIAGGSTCAVTSALATSLKGGILLYTQLEATVWTPVSATTVTFSATCAVGDFIEVCSDGANWQLHGASSTAAGLA